MVINRIIAILNDYKRVLSVAKKPTRDDLKEIIRVCGIGMAVIGFIGFVFFLIFAFSGGY